MLAIKPSEHQCRTQNRRSNSTLYDHALLLFFGPGVKVICHRLHDRRTDMYKLRYFMGFEGFKYQASGIQVITHKFLMVIPSYLCLQHHNNTCIFKMHLPLAR